MSVRNETNEEWQWRMKWLLPPILMAAHELGSSLPFHRAENPPRIYRPHDKQGDVEPFDVSADWDERHA